MRLGYEFVSSYYVTVNLITEYTNNKASYKKLTHLMPKLPSYRNHSTDLLCKSIDWFIYDGNYGV